jgi:hypothetical protein
MKKIIQRRLPLDVRYTVTDKIYIPVLDGCGTCCENCGALIANIATVKSSNGSYNIGFDCLETFLINNNLLDGYTLEELEKVKKNISKVLRFSKTIKETLEKNKHLKITGLLFEVPTWDRWVTFYWLQNNQQTSRDNDGFKTKDLDFNFLIETLKNIFPGLQILIK